jgi:hypothetical protein
MTTATRRPAPVQPADLADLIRCLNASVRAANGCYRGMFAPGGPVCSGLVEAEQRYRQEATEWRNLITAWYATPEGKAYWAAVNAYNAYVDAHNAAVKTRRQARRNAAETARVRSAACPTCFATHPGDC